MKRIILSWLLCFILIPAAVEAAAEPIDVLKEPIEQVIAILKDPALKSPEKRAEQRKKLWEIARQVFDFEAIARGTLKRYRWKSFTKKQREDFTEAFTLFIGNNYFNKIQSGYKNEKVIFIDQIKKGEKKATVRSKILRESLEIPVEYSMWKRGGRWRIFNVYIEGTSLLGNYRNEFEKILMDHDPDYLIQTLQKRAEELEEGKKNE